jgi:hypothetical protein
MSIHDKYHSWAATQYREKVSTLPKHRILSDPRVTFGLISSMQTSKINPGLLRPHRKVLHPHAAVLQPPEVVHLLLKAYASRVLPLAPLRARPRVPIRPLRPSRQTQPAHI